MTAEPSSPAPVAEEKMPPKSKAKRKLDEKHVSLTQVSELLQQ